MAIVEVGTIKALVDGLKFAKETLQLINQGKIQIEANQRMQEAFERLGSVQVHFLNFLCF